jgi:hypothetical protein
MHVTWGRTGVAHAGVVDFDADFVGLWRGNLDIFNCEVLPRLPRNCRL